MELLLLLLFCFLLDFIDELVQCLCITAFRNTEELAHLVLGVYIYLQSKSFKFSVLNIADSFSLVCDCIQIIFMDSVVL